MRKRPSHVYGRRKGHRLSAKKEALFKTLLPKIAVPVEGFAEKTLDPRKLFPEPVTDVWLEIGFGKGEHLAAQAKANPAIGFIGCEPFQNGVAGLLTAIEKDNLTNVRIYPDDARHVLAALLPSSLGRVFLLHPDPWPKNRHAKRRFINRDTLLLLSRVLKKGAELRFASDHGVMVTWTLAHLQNFPDFAWEAERAQDWRLRPKDWPDTRYGAKARGRRETPVTLIFKKT